MTRRFLACGFGLLVFGCSAFERRPEVCTTAKGTVTLTAKVGDVSTPQTVRFASEHCAATGPSKE